MSFPAAPDDAETAQFRLMIHEFIADNLPRKLQERSRRGFWYLRKQDYVFWQRKLYERGWAAPNWPVEFGGAGWTPLQCQIFDDECSLASCPRIQPQALKMLGPVIYTFGTEQQKQRFLGGILSGDDFWCQGYSEPGAGSDLAALNTRAVPEGGTYKVTGQKIWTTKAHWADYVFCLVRTSGTNEKERQSGITFLLIDMRSAGITVKPIISIDDNHSFNEVFFDNVIVPVENRIGKEGDGWTYGKFLLGKERAGVAEFGRSKERLDRLKKIAEDNTINRDPLSADPAFRNKIAKLEIEMIAVEMTSLRLLSLGQDSFAGLPSMLRLRGAEIAQHISELSVEALGPNALRYDMDEVTALEPRAGALPGYAVGMMPEHFTLRSQTIAGGTTEIQKNIITKSLFR